MRDMQVIEDTAKQQERGEELYRRVLEEMWNPVRIQRGRQHMAPLFHAPQQSALVELAVDEPSQVEDTLQRWTASDPGSLGMLMGRPLRELGPHHALVTLGAVQELQHAMTHRRETLQVKPAGDVKAYVSTMAAWGFTDIEAGKMLGFRDRDLAAELFKGTIEVPVGEVDERLTILTKLILDLEGMYEDDAVIRKWLDLDRVELGGRTPRELLVSGTFDGLFKVRSLVRYEARR